MQVPNKFDYPLVFVDAGENLIMADDVTMLSNPPIAPVEQENLEEASLDVNVSQRSCEEKSSKRVVCTRVDCSIWDRDYLLTHMP
jgi:hypothetical protein